MFLNNDLEIKCRNSLADSSLWTAQHVQAMLYLNIGLKKKWFNAGVCCVKQTDAKMFMVDLW